MGSEIAPVVDVHCHLFKDICPVGVDLESVLRGGPWADILVDAGTYGASDFKAFASRVRRFNTQRTWPAILGLVNVAVGGMSRLPEILSPEDFQPDLAVRVAEEHHDVAVGLKVRAIAPASQLLGLRLVADAKRAASDAGLPVVVHIGQQDDAHGPQGFTVSVLDLLDEGDVATHMYSALQGGIVFDSSAREAAIRARARGVFFDIGHGAHNFNFLAATHGAAMGLGPDFISSDVTSATASWLSLTRSMEAAAAAGIPIPVVIDAVTERPFRWLGAPEVPRMCTISAKLEGHTYEDSQGNGFAAPYRFSIGTLSGECAEHATEW